MRLRWPSRMWWRWTAGGMVVLDAVREIRPPFDPLAVTAEVAAVLKTYGIREAQADKFAGAWVTEAFARHGVVVVQDAEPKAALYLAALPAFTSQRVDLLDLPRLRAQLVGLERRRRPGGRDVVDHAPGGHDDVANVVAGIIAQLAVARGFEVLCTRPEDIPVGIVETWHDADPDAWAW